MFSAALVFDALLGLSLLVTCGITLHRSTRPSHQRGVSCCGARALGCAGSSSCLMRAQWFDPPSCSTARGIFLDQGLNLHPLHWQVSSYPLHQQRRPCVSLKRFLYCSFFRFLPDGDFIKYLMKRGLKVWKGVESRLYSSLLKFHFTVFTQSHCYFPPSIIKAHISL